MKRDFSIRILICTLFTFSFSRYFHTNVIFNIMQIGCSCYSIMHFRLHLLPCMAIFYVLLFLLTPTENASAIKIRPDVCTNAMGEHGTCMFVWECIKQDGRQLGPCVDRFLVGTCCSLPSEDDNIVPGAGLPFEEDEKNKVKPEASNVHIASVNFPSIGVTSSTLTIDSSIINTSTSASGVGTSLKSSAIPTTSSPQKTPWTADYSECGVPSPQPKMKVVGGTHAAFGDWPWQVSVRRTSFFGFASTHRCGGAILSEKWVATAGHCVDDLLKSQIRVRVGEFDFSTTQEPYPFQERSIEKKIVHPKYNFFTYENDLALLKLDSPVQLQPHIKPICLPPTNDTLVGQNATVTGWGRLSEGGILPSMLQKVQVPIISNTKCKDMFLKAGRQESIPDIFMCAGYEQGGRDSCQGDSGGPLQVKGENGRWFLAGIISWGIGCAEANMPGVCTRITKFANWIEDTMQNKK